MFTKGEPRWPRIPKETNKDKTDAATLRLGDERKVGGVPESWHAWLSSVAALSSLLLTPILQQATNEKTSAIGHLVASISALFLMYLAVRYLGFAKSSGTSLAGRLSSIYIFFLSSFVAILLVDQFSELVVLPGRASQFSWEDIPFGFAESFFTLLALAGFLEFARRKLSDHYRPIAGIPFVVALIVIFFASLDGSSELDLPIGEVESSTVLNAINQLFCLLLAIGLSLSAFVGKRSSKD